MVSITVVGDYQPDNETHAAIAGAVQHSSADLGIETVVRWVGTDEFGDRAPNGDALWIASGSPYRSFEGALEAIQWARTTDTPLLGTCGGFQHAVIEFARNVAGLREAHHAEYETGDTLLVVDELACSLAGQTMDVTLVPGSKAHNAYGSDRTTERYYCRFGLNEEFVPTLLSHGLAISGTDTEGEPRIVELPGHRFFVATLFVPQTASTATRPHPLVSAFVCAAARQPVP